MNQKRTVIVWLLCAVLGALMLQDLLAPAGHGNHCGTLGHIHRISSENLAKSSDLSLVNDADSDCHGSQTIAGFFVLPVQPQIEFEVALMVSTVLVPKEFLYQDVELGRRRKPPKST